LDAEHLRQTEQHGFEILRQREGRIHHHDAGRDELLAVAIERRHMQLVRQPLKLARNLERRIDEDNPAPLLRRQQRFQRHTTVEP